MASVRRPPQTGASEVDEADLRLLMCLVGKVKPVQFMGGELVAGQGVVVLVELGPTTFPG